MSESWQCEFCGMPACDCPVGRYREEIATLRGRCERLRRICMAYVGGTGPLTTKYRDVLIRDGSLHPDDLDDNLTEPT